MTQTDPRSLLYRQLDPARAQALINHNSNAPVDFAADRIEVQSRADRVVVAAGAVLVGALNMDEYAYGFTTENTHYGPTRNPHDPGHTPGGSSSGTAVALTFFIERSVSASRRVTAQLRTRRLR